MKIIYILLSVVLFFLSISCQNNLSKTDQSTIMILKGNEIIKNSYYNFGNVNIGSYKEVTFYIKNAGGFDLELKEGTPYLSYINDFTLVKPSKKILKINESVSFTVCFAPTALYDSNNIIIFKSNDPLNSTLNLFLEGYGVTKSQDFKPITIEGWIITNNSIYIGYYKLNSLTHNISFVIKNNTNDTITLSGNPLVTIDTTSEDIIFVSSPPSLEIQANGTTSFSIKILPKTTGSKTAKLSFIFNSNYSYYFYINYTAQ
ncbi:MAG: hypothetical protein A2086_03850 [Spirochaetes bacterium GWD1_27_9]|nr:MAG: hypothetical protein A2Z98_08715 [Spirochaetes bacterium GWB1_27_13]OHD24038.1 MAG: hypothetical protein A2Y34_14020 [Spirochaetes bacterium GWC1_27_15]OHD30678.1 MAG: hypothetical protein A2086_03850 [Spirochaetes bacterium GWD1_27_9]